MTNILLLQNLISLPENLVATLAQANIVTKTDFDNKRSSLNKKKYFK